MMDATRSRTVALFTTVASVMLAALATVVAGPSAYAITSDPGSWKYGCAVTYTVLPDAAEWTPAITAALGRISAVTKQTFTPVPSGGSITFRSVTGIPGYTPPDGGWMLVTGSAPTPRIVWTGPWEGNAQTMPPFWPNARENSVARSVMQIMGLHSSDPNTVLGGHLVESTDLTPSDIAELDTIRTLNRCGTADAVIVAAPKPSTVLPGVTYDVISTWRGRKVTARICARIPHAIWLSESGLCVAPVTTGR